MQITDPVISHHLISLTLCQRANVFVILPVMAWHRQSGMDQQEQCMIVAHLAFTRKQQKKGQDKREGGQDKDG
jgi:hypothetical protein